jgi:hypothetical protein
VCVIIIRKHRCLMLPPPPPEPAHPHTHCGWVYVYIQGEEKDKAPMTTEAAETAARDQVCVYLHTLPPSLLSLSLSLSLARARSLSYEIYEKLYNFFCVNFGIFYRFFHKLIFKELKGGGYRRSPCMK